LPLIRALPSVASAVDVFKLWKSTPVLMSRCKSWFSATDCRWLLQQRLSTTAAAAAAPAAAAVAGATTSMGFDTSWKNMTGPCTCPVQLQIDGALEYRMNTALQMTLLLQRISPYTPCTIETQLGNCYCMGTPHLLLSTCLTARCPACFSAPGKQPARHSAWQPGSSSRSSSYSSNKTRCI